MRIIITQELIDEGVHRSCRYCPIGLAFLELGIPTVWVTMIGAFYSMNPYETDIDAATRVKLPDIAIDFINKFDNGEHVEPLEFTCSLTI